MDTFLIKAAQLILAFAILVIIHEFGHFLFARIFGVKVEKFYVFFDPWKEIFKWKPKKYYGFFGKTKKFKNAVDDCEDESLSADHPSEGYDAKGDAQPAETTGQESAKDKKKKKSFWGDTEYGIGWLPLGGYCKIAGMIDESMDTEQMKQPAKEWEFRSKPAWQRLLIMIAGVLFNFLLAIIIYAGIVYATGEKYVPFENADMGMAYSGVAHDVGFRDGDIPLEADGDKLSNPNDARMKMLQAKTVTVLRDNRKVNIDIPSDFMLRLDEEMKSDSVDINFMIYRIPVEITKIAPGEGAEKAGIKEGDRIVAIDSTPTPSLDVFFKTLKGHDNKTVPFSIARNVGNNRIDTITVNVPLSESSKMGVGLQVDPSTFFKSEEIRYNLFQSIPRGIEIGTDKLTSYAKSMKLVFTKEGAKSIGGFGAIGSIFPEKWDWIAFWNIAAFLSVALAFMNILPIPALDGGHVLFLLYEVITGRKPSDKFLEYAQWIGMTLLILLLLYANGMDIVRFFFK